MSKNPYITNTLENLYYRNKVKSFNLYIVVVLVIVLIFVLLPIIKIDISTQSRGIIRTTSENVPISSIVSGRVTSVNLYNNQDVKKGDTLLSIETSPLDAQTIMNIDMREDLSAILEDLNKVTSGRTGSLQTSEIQREYQTYVQRHQEALSSLQQSQRVYNRNKSLYDQGVISASEIERYEYELQTSKTSIRTLEQQQFASWQTQKREISQQIKNYSGTINQINANKKNYYITAPISGSIMNFTGIQKGSLLNASQAVGEISAQDGIQVETYVSPNDIGLIQKGQILNFQIDAYNYNQWGMATGKVLDIDQNITQQPDGTGFFKVWCQLDQDHLQLKNGYKGSVKKGMTLTSRFIINRRSLWNLLYDKVDDWLNPKIITKETE